MRRPLVLYCAALLAGCQSTMPAVDPFLGRTTVPPPGTGEAMPISPGQPYYPGAAPGSPPAAAPGPSSSAPASPYVPPGGSYGYPQGKLERRGTSPAQMQLLTDRRSTAAQGALDQKPGAQTAEYEEPLGVAGAAAQQRAIVLTGGDDEQAASVEATAGSEIRIVEPDTAGNPEEQGAPGPFSPSAGPSAAEPRPFKPAPDAIDIADLPPAQKTARPPDRASRNARYEYEPDYSRLRGQLEFSLVDQRWKLRYIPIDGDTDDYGGSVVLEGHAMDDFRPGQFVTVYGSLQGPTATSGFSPLYRVEQVEASAF